MKPLAAAPLPPECVKHSPVWFRSIEAMLGSHRRNAAFSAAAFEHAALEVMKEASSMVVPVAIRAGTITVFRHSPLRLFSWLEQMLKILHDANTLKPLPDAYFLLSSSAWAIRSMLSANSSVALLSTCTGDSNSDYAVPGGQFDDELDTFYSEISFGLQPEIPWQARKSTAVWRGSLMCENFAACHTRCPRLQIWLAAQRHRDVLDVRWSGSIVFSTLQFISSCTSNETAEASMREYRDDAFRLNRSELAKFAFTISSDGHSYASNLKYNLVSGSVVLRSRSNFLEFFEYALEPYVHYIPFDCIDGLNDCELVSIVQQAGAPEAVLRMTAIAAAARNFAISHLRPDGLACFWHELLHVIARSFVDGAYLSDKVFNNLLEFSLKNTK